MKMIITKEKNLIRFVKGKEERTFDLNTGKVYGKNGRETSGAFFKQGILNVPDETSEYFYLARGITIENWGNEALKFFNTLFSLYSPVDIESNIYNINWYKPCFSHIKLLGTYKTLNNEEGFNPFDFQAFVTKKAYPFLESFDTRVCNTFNIVTNEYSDYKNIIIYYFQKFYLFYNSPNDALCDIRRYFRFCKEIDKEPRKTSNFMQEYVETKKEYLQWKEDHDLKAFEANCKEKEKAFDFTFGNYTIVVPKKPEDLIIEGRLMHHCVGSYINKVVNKECYIVFVRNKDNKEEPYITCQVMPDGTINQYYLAYDRNIVLKEDREFRLAFQKHIRENWN